MTESRASFRFHLSRCQGYCWSLSSQWLSILFISHVWASLSWICLWIRPLTRKTANLVKATLLDQSCDYLCLWEQRFQLLWTPFEARSVIEAIRNLQYFLCLWRRPPLWWQLVAIIHAKWLSHLLTRRSHQAWDFLPLYLKVPSLPFCLPLVLKEFFFVSSYNW